MDSSLLVVNTSNSQVPSSPILSSAYISARENNANEADKTIFTRNGSPLLIVAFLATGALAVALAFTFCWRVRHTQRVVVHAVGRPVRNPTKLCDVREKPVLWETWPQNAGDKGGATSCVNMMPFSVERRRRTYPLSESTARQATLPTVRRIHQRAPQPRLAHRSRLSEVENQAGERLPHTLVDGALAKGSSLQIAVIIAMPTLKAPQGNPPLVLEGMLEGELADFCIGVTEVPVEDG